MSIIGNLVFANDHWIRAKANQNELATELQRRILVLTEAEQGKQWVRDVAEQYGELVAVKPLKVLRGLAGYPKQTFWQYVFKIGTPMDLVVTRTHLLFFDPAFSPGANLTAVSKDDVVRTAVNYGDGSQLHVKTRDGFIRCKVGWSMEAKPIWSVIEEVFFGRKNVR